MKLLYVHTSDISSRRANMQQVIHMCNAFAYCGVDVVLSLFSSKNFEKDSKLLLEKEYGKINFRIITRSIFISSVVDPYIVVSSLKKIVNDENPDLIFLRTNLYIDEAISFNIPVIYESHSAILHSRITLFDKYWKKKIASLSKHDEKFFVVAISDALKEYWIQQGVSEHKIVALHDGFQESMFKEIIEKTDARQILGLESKKLIATYCGNLNSDRGIDNIISLAQNFPDIDFLVVGGPVEMKDEYSTLSDKLKINNIKFLGRVLHKDIPNYLFASDILIAVWSKSVKTINWCSPLKIFEYMASEKTIIAQGFPTIKEVLHDNYNSLIAQPDCIEDLIRCIDRVKSGEELKHLGHNARREAFEHYTWNKRAENILRFFHRNHV